MRISAALVMIFMLLEGSLEHLPLEMRANRVRGHRIAHILAACVVSVVNIRGENGAGVLLWWATHRKERGGEQ